MRARVCVRARFSIFNCDLAFSGAYQIEGQSRVIFDACLRFAIIELIERKHKNEQASLDLFRELQAITSYHGHVIQPQLATT